MAPPKSETTEKQIHKMFASMGKQWDKTGDPKLLEAMNNLGVTFRKMGMAEEKREQARLVRSHIERRAELKEKTGMQFPNIARILTGGAGSPVGMMGKMQQRATEPFKAVYEYQKGQEEMKELSGKKKRTKKEDDRLKYLETEEGGREGRAKSGFGGNLMGKKMQGMIGKVGKFMESSKGQGMMAGGMMGASILTMIIKKAMEASPMLQQMLKIMNVAMTLFLRPIGDFIGGMLKPIMLFFLREVAIPMLAKGKGMIKMGEQFGKQALGFLLKPVETISNAIQLAMNPLLMPAERAMMENFDGIKEWMSEQKLAVLAEQMGQKDFRDIVTMLRNQEMGGFGTAVGPGGMTSTAAVDGAKQLEELQKMFPEMMDDFEKIFKGQGNNTYSWINNRMSSGGGTAGGVGAGMGEISADHKAFGTASDNFTKAVDKFVAGLTPETQNDADAQLARDFDAAITGGKEKPEGWVNPNAIATDTSGIGKGGILPDVSTEQSAFLARVDELLEQMRKPNEKVDGVYQERMTGDAAWTEAMAELKSMAEKNISVLDSMKEAAVPGSTIPEGSYFNTAMDIPDSAGGNKGLTDESEAQEDMLNQAGINAKNTADTYQEIDESVNKVKILQTKGWSSYKLMTDYTVSSAEEVKKDTKATMDFFKGSAALALQGFLAVQTLIAQFVAMKQAFNKSNKKRQHGGMINEPIFGIGESGQTYTFGEAGPEMVTPMFGGKPKGGGIGPVNINVNIEKVSDDVDLEKLKPVIERALQEVHARRGII